MGWEEGLEEGLEARPTCEECRAEEAHPYTSGGHTIWLCDDCAQRTCYGCGKRITGSPVPGWSDEVGGIWLCEVCAEVEE